MSPRKIKRSVSVQPASSFAVQHTLVKDIRALIEQARANVAAAVNAGLTVLYWQIGKRIHETILKGARADYGSRIIVELGKQLAGEFGRGFSEKSLRHMIRFFEAFPKEQIVSSLLRQLSWTHGTIYSLA